MWGGRRQKEGWEKGYVRIDHFPRRLPDSD